jgi:chromosome segregation ATPase
MTRKLDSDHVEAIQKLQTEFTESSAQIGRIAIDLHYAETQVASLKQMQLNAMDRFETLREQETTLIAQLKEHYGEGQIDVTTGTFTPAE